MSPAKRGRKPAPPRSGHRRTAAGPHRAPPLARGLGGDQVEGRHAVRELLLGGRRVRELWVATDTGETGTGDTGTLDEIVDLAREMRVTIREVSRNKLAAEARTEAPQGVLAKAAPLQEVELDELANARAASGAKPFLIVADGVTDPGNLGALLRSAGLCGRDWCRAAAPSRGPRHPDGDEGSGRRDRASAHGARRRHPERPLTAARARRLGGRARHGRRSHAVRPRGRRARADRPGARRRGTGDLTARARQRCDVVVRIPLIGPLESLNVAAAGTVACYEVARHRI